MMMFDLIELMLIVPPSGIPTDEEQATGMERIIMKAMQEGSVRLLIWIHLNLSSVLEGCPPSVMFMINRSITDWLDDVKVYLCHLKEGTPLKKKSTYPFNISGALLSDIPLLQHYIPSTVQHSYSYAVY